MMEAMTPPTTVPPLSPAMRLAADMLSPVPARGCSWAMWREMSIRAPARNQKEDTPISLSLKSRWLQRYLSLSLIHI